MPLPDAAPWTEAEYLAYEKEALGLYLSGHPMDRFADALKARGVLTIADLTASATDITVGGIISAHRPLTTRRGGRMAVLTLEDRGGAVEVVVFPDAYVKCAALIEKDRLVLVRGKLEMDEESARLLAAELLPIEGLAARAPQAIAIRLSAPPHDRRTFRSAGGTVRPLPRRSARFGGARAARSSAATEGARRPRRDADPAVGPTHGRSRAALRQGGPYPGSSMHSETLDFEEPIVVLLKEIQALGLLPRTAERQREIEQLRARVETVRREIYAHLTAWQRVLVARHPNRPNTLDYVARLFTEFTELHGDRRFGDDHAVVAGFAFLDGRPVFVVGHQKGVTPSRRSFEISATQDRRGTGRPSGR